MHWLVQFLIGNAIIAAVLGLVATAAMRFRRPALAHGLWLLAMLKLLTPPIWDIPIPWPSFESTVAAKPQAVVAPAPKVNTDNTEQFTLVAPQFTVQPVDVHPLETPVAVQPRSEIQLPSLTETLVFLWIVGSAIWIAVMLIRIQRFRRLIGRADSVPQDLQDRVNQLAHRMGLRKAPAAYLLSATVSPMLWAAGRSPHLVLPKSLLGELDDQQRDALLVHELAHLARRDHWCRVIELIAMGVYWWHPLLWWARSGLREAEEQCCDAWVMWAMPEAQRSYADALVDTLDFLAGESGQATLPPVASGLGRLTNLQRRLTMIFTHTPPRSMSIVGRLVIVSLFGVLPLVPVLGQATRPGAVVNPPASAMQSGPTTQALVEALLEAAGDDNEAVQSAARQAMADMGSAAVPALVSAVSSGNAQVRSASLEILTSIVESSPGMSNRLRPGGLFYRGVQGGGGFNGGRGGRSSGGGRGGGFLNLPPSVNRMASAPAASKESLDLQAMVAPAAVKAASDSEIAVRQAAVHLVGRLVDQPDLTLPVLIVALRDSEMGLRELAIQGLGTLASVQGGARVSSATPALVQRLEDTQPGLRVRAIQVLGQIGPPAQSALPDLLKALKDRDAGVRSAAAWAIGQIKSPPPVVMAEPDFGGDMDFNTGPSLEEQMRMRREAQQKPAPTAPATR